MSFFSGLGLVAERRIGKEVLVHEDGEAALGVGAGLVPRREGVAPGVVGDSGSDGGVVKLLAPLGQGVHDGLGAICEHTFCRRPARVAFQIPCEFAGLDQRGGEHEALAAHGFGVGLRRIVDQDGFGCSAACTVGLNDGRLGEFEDEIGDGSGILGLCGLWVIGQRPAKGGEDFWKGLLDSARAIGELDADWFLAEPELECRRLDARQHDRDELVAVLAALRDLAGVLDFFLDPWRVGCLGAEDDEELRSLLNGFLDARPQGFASGKLP